MKLDALNTEFIDLTRPLPPKEQPDWDSIVEGSLWRVSGRRLHNVAAFSCYWGFLGLYDKDEPITVRAHGITKVHAQHRLTVGTENFLDPGGGAYAHYELGSVPVDISVTPDSNELMMQLLAANNLFALGQLAQIEDPAFVQRFGSLEAYQEWHVAVSECQAFYAKLIGEISMGTKVVQNGMINILAGDTLTQAQAV